MAQMTLQERLCRGLILLGCVEIKPTTKYRCFDAHSPTFPQMRHYVGRAGALRTSRSGKVTQTYDAQELRRQALKAVNDQLAML